MRGNGKNTWVAQSCDTPPRSGGRRIPVASPISEAWACVDRLGLPTARQKGMQTCGVTNASEVLTIDW